MTSTTTDHEFDEVSDRAIASAAARLLAAEASHTACAPVRDLIGARNLAAAYAVQEHITAARLADGALIVGRKIGLTSAAVQAQLGVDQPDFGVLFEDMDASETQIPAGRLFAPKAEAEIAFILASDLIDGELHIDQVRAAVAGASAAIEIVDSRIADWDITFGDTVADNGSSGMFVLGRDQIGLDSFEPAEASMEMRVNDNIVSVGRGSASLGDPLRALAWLARTAREHRRPLLAGQVVLSGALGPMFAISPGDEVAATISGLGSVSVAFEPLTTSPLST